MCVPGAEEPASERKRLWQALKSRVVYSALFQPSPLFFVVCLFLLAACMPLLAAYLGRASLLPDLDTMKVTNYTPISLRLLKEANLYAVLERVPWQLEQPEILRS